jgi:glyoxylase-like metal-dependent hydrolase (beta-lactamase superfamily II)
MLPTTMLVPRLAAAVIVLACAVSAAAQADLEILPVQGNVFVIVGPGGNTTVQVGHEAVVIVDTQTGAVADQVLEAVEKLSTKPIRHIINTNADADHTGGNEALSRAGTYVRLIDTFDPRGSSSDAAIIAHVNVLARMSAPTGMVAAAPSGAWPSDTYFTDDWALFVNREAVQLLHVPKAHTDGDTMVFFRRSDVLSTGDIFSTSRYPKFDRMRGGSIAGVIEGLNRILDITIPGENQEGGTVVIPGHGRLSDETEVANYRDMVTIIRDRVDAMIAAGLTLEQVQAAGPTRDYDGIYADEAGDWTGAMFVEALYRDLQGEGE